ncbi:MAG: hypothetical protein HC778_01800 [Chamaesiphon sp. CSU_1_12]|nr:hypothetical protein [Chamaesiphon sp. CSU_1_12]
MTMTKYQRSKHNSNVIDRIYNSRSVDFWLVVANLVTIANWFMSPESLGAVGLMAGGLGLAIFTTILTNRKAQQTFQEFKRNYKSTGLLTLALSLLVVVTVFNYATSPSQALILTNDGVAQLTALFNGSTSGSASTATSDVIKSIFVIFRALFFIGFMIALYKAYENIPTKQR